MKGTTLVAAVVIAASVVAVPLLLKSNRAASTPGNQSPQAAKGLPRFVDLGTTTCTPCRVLLRNVITDEARHVDYGVVALGDFYPKEIGEKEREKSADQLTANEWL